MKLTEKQESFAQLIAGGSTQADAYRGAYDCENSSDNVIYNESIKLAKHHGITMRVKKLKEDLEIASLWSRKDSVETLSVIAKGSERDGDRVNAVKTINAMHGWDKQVIDHTSTDGTMATKEVSIKQITNTMDPMEATRVYQDMINGTSPD